MTTHPATPTPTDLPEALRLADICERKGMFAPADELRRLHTLAAPTTEQSSEVAQAGAPTDERRVDGFVNFMLTNCTNLELHAHEERAIRDMVRNLQEWRNGKHDDYVRGLGSKEPGSPALAGGGHRVDSGADPVATGGAVAPQEGAESYPPINPREFHHTSELWALIDAWFHATPGASSGSRAESINECIQGLMRAYADATVALRARVAVPSGWKLVPVEPNDDMLEVFNASDAYFIRHNKENRPSERYEVVDRDSDFLVVGAFADDDEADAMAARLSYAKHYRAMLAAAPQPPAALPGEKDAARYRYLRDTPMEDWPAMLQSAIQMQQNARWDSLIDAAMATAKGRTEGGAA